MWSEKRGIESYIIFAILPILINISTNSIYFIRGGSYSSIEIINSSNKFTIFSVLICCIFNFFTKQRELSDEEKEELNKKMYGMKLLSIVFIGYVIFTVFIVRNISIIISSLIMYIAYINCYMFKSKIRSINTLTETQRNWREFHNRYSYEDTNFLWRIKPMLTPHVSVRFNERINNINWFSIIVIAPFFKGFTLETVPIMLIIFILSISDILYFVDVIFGLYTETEGTCTGIIMKQSSSRSSRYRRIYYEVYVTDFLNKREVKFRVDDYCYHNEGDVIKVIHGGLSKKVIETKVSNTYI